MLILPLVSLALALVPNARSVGANVWESGYRLDTCDFLDGCIPSYESGVQASIAVNSETVSQDGIDVLAEWLSIDNPVNCSICGITYHDWLQTGWIVGNLPDGTFTSTPIAYAESEVGSGCPSSPSLPCTYTFQKLAPLTFGSSYTFTVQLASPSTVSLNGVVMYSVAYLKDVFHGQVAAFAENHEPVYVNVPNRSASGHWSNLQFRFNAGDSWVSFGSADPNDPFPNHTQNAIYETCGFNSVNAISVTDFSLSAVPAWCTGVGGGSRYTAHPELPPASTQLVGPGPSGGAPSFGDPDAGWIHSLGVILFLYVVPAVVIAGVVGLLFWIRAWRNRRV
jgi:hypothetical protein